MMKYGVFTEAVKERIKDFLPERYQDLEAALTSVEKVNTVFTGITFHDQNKKAMQVSPVIYLENAYEEYRSSEWKLDDILQKIANTATAALDSAKDYGKENLQEKLQEDRIYYQLVNTEQNREFLNNKPNREYMDMSIMYRYMIGKNPETGTISSVPITSQLAKEKGLTEERLYELAHQNTKELFPLRVSGLKELMANLMKKDGMEDDMVEAMLQGEEFDSPLYVISNDEGVIGASAVLYDNAMQPLAEKLGSDLYVMPASIHEMIAVPVSSGVAPEELAEMVQQINEKEVSLEDRLSNNVYLYDKDSRELSMATDVPEKRLDYEQEPSRRL